MNNAEVALKAYQNIQSLTARKKVVTQEHSERIKRLKKILDNVSTRSTAGQGRAGTARQARRGSAGLGKARQARQGAARLGWARQGMA